MNWNNAIFADFSDFERSLRKAEEEERREARRLAIALTRRRELSVARPAKRRAARHVHERG